MFCYIELCVKPVGCISVVEDLKLIHLVLTFQNKYKTVNISHCDRKATLPFKGDKTMSVLLIKDT